MPDTGERLLYLVIGIVAGFAAAFALEAVRVWRVDERNRKNMCKYIRLLIHETEERRNILYHGTLNPDQQNVEDALKQISKDSYSFAEDLKGLRVVFEAYPDKILQMRDRAAELTVLHYEGRTESLRDNSRIYRDLPGVRSEVFSLISELRGELEYFASRSFLGWAWMWVRGAE
jgi:hypothetical protein